MTHVESYEVDDSGAPRGKMVHKVHAESGTTYCGKNVARVEEENRAKLGGRVVWPDLGMVCCGCDGIVRVVLRRDVSSLQPECVLPFVKRALFDAGLGPSIHSCSPGWLHSSRVGWLAIVSLRLQALDATVPTAAHEVVVLTARLADELRAHLTASASDVPEAERAVFVRWALGAEPVEQNTIAVKELAQDPPAWRLS